MRNTSCGWLAEEQGPIVLLSLGIVFRVTLYNAGFLPAVCLLWLGDTACVDAAVAVALELSLISYI